MENNYFLALTVAAFNIAFLVSATPSSIFPLSFFLNPPHNPITQGLFAFPIRQIFFLSSKWNGINHVQYYFAFYPFRTVFVFVFSLRIEVARG